MKTDTVIGKNQEVMNYYFVNNDGKIRGVAFEKHNALGLFKRAETMYGEKLKCVVVREVA